MAVLLTVGLVVLLTVLTLAISGWRRGRPGLPGLPGDTSDDEPVPDTWHGDPRDDVTGRPAGADAEAMAPPSGEARRSRHSGFGPGRRGKSRA
jgi:hypothetical protein